MENFRFTHRSDRPDAQVQHTQGSAGNASMLDPRNHGTPAVHAKVYVELSISLDREGFEHK